MATPAAQLQSFAFLCDLQPFVDARLVTTLHAVAQGGALARANY